MRWVLVECSDPIPIASDPSGVAQWVSVPVEGPPGPQGIQGPAGASGNSYDHTQASPAAVWTVNHNLGYMPDVSVFTSGGLEVEAEILHLSSNQTQITMLVPMAGFARFS